MASPQSHHKTTDGIKYSFLAGEEKGIEEEELAQFLMV